MNGCSPEVPFRTGSDRTGQPAGVSLSGIPAGQSAEGVGFEPTRKLAPPSGFQDRRHRPLGEPSSLRRGTDSVAAAADPCLVRSLDVRPWKSDPGVEPSLSYPAIGRRLPAVTAMPNIDPYRG